MTTTHFWIFIAFICVSCGPLENPAQSENPAKIAPEIKPHYDTFLLEADERKIQLDLKKLKSLTVVSDDNFPLGRCAEGNVTINLKKVRGDTCTLMVAVYHELGHCLLNKKHSPQDGYVHIMQAKMEPSCAIYLFSWKILLDELFAEK